MATNISIAQNTTHLGGTTTKIVPVHANFFSNIMDRATSGGGTNGGEITKSSNGVILRSVNTIPIMSNGNGLGNIQVLTKRFNGIKGANGTSSGLLLNGTQIQLKGSTGALAGGGNLLILKTISSGNGSTSSNGENKMKTVIVKTATGQQKFEPVIICSKFNSIGTKHTGSVPVTLANKRIKLDVKPEGVAKNGEIKTLVINAKKEVTMKESSTKTTTTTTAPTTVNKESTRKVEELPTKKKNYYMLPEKIFDTDDEDEEDDLFCNQENLFNHFNTTRFLHRLRSSALTFKPPPAGTLPTGLGNKPPPISLNPVIKEEEDDSSIVEVTSSLVRPEPIITTVAATTINAPVSSPTSLVLPTNVVPIQQAKLPETIKIPLVPPATSLSTIKPAAQITLKNGVVNSVPSTVILNGTMKATPTVMVTNGTVKAENNTILLPQVIKAMKANSDGVVIKGKEIRIAESSAEVKKGLVRSLNKKKTTTTSPVPVGKTNMVSLVKKKKELPVQRRRRQIWQKLLKELSSRRDKVMNTGLERRARSKMLATQCRKWKSTNRLLPANNYHMPSNMFINETSILTTTVTVNSAASNSLLLMRSDN